MLTVGDSFPDFDLATVEGATHPKLSRIRSADFKGCWFVVFFWPADFSEEYPSELSEFARLHPLFLASGAQLVGVSTDHECVHLAWRQDEGCLARIDYPMASDHSCALSTSLGIVHPKTTRALRAAFVIDPAGVIRYASAHDGEHGRSADDVLRALLALQARHRWADHWGDRRRLLPCVGSPGLHRIGTQV